MSSDGRYYWVKLDYSRFESGGDLDFLMGQPNGSEYVALYLMLCLNTRNTDGELISKLGEVIIPYDVEKIKRDCKYFSRDTIVIAISLFKQLGLIFEQENGILKINSFDSMVGSTSTSAARVKRMRERQKTLAIESECNTVQQDNTEALHCNAKCNKNVTTDIRDKRLDTRDKNKDIIEDSYEDNKLSSNSSSLALHPSDEKCRTESKSLKTSTAQLKEKEEVIFTYLPLAGGKEAAIPESWCDEMQKLIPACVNVREEILNAKRWCLTHPTKLKKDWKRFLNSWFDRQLANGGSATPYEETRATEEAIEELPVWRKEDIRASYQIYEDLTGEERVSFYEERREDIELYLKLKERGEI